MNQEPVAAAPEYCHFFKTLLVEELELETDFQRLHYGQCAIVGRLVLESKFYRLENVRVKSLPNNLSLPEGTISLLLLGLTFDKAAEQSVASGSYCIVRGEVVLCNVVQPNSRMLTSRGVHDKFTSLSHNPAAQKEYLSRLRLTHKPALDLWFIQSIDRAEELLRSRLEIRGLTVR
ncbi:uncharacterized protein LOC108025115 [Drosophila biarmipes]|uniref:uncharacterized protein LOC108025115 n=1 Tax=Drosophila biarmipes TaxID=125945 RepID=UPI0007E799DC|nr:uncharacterized protein LOC108025115 [Drosophila biarmipes]